MIDYAQGEYILVEIEDLAGYLLAIGSTLSEIDIIFKNPTKVEIMNPSHPQSPNPGYWCINENFGGFQTNVVIDQSKEHIDIEEQLGSEPYTMNRFYWRQWNILAQVKASDVYACVILRQFDENGFIMILLECNSGKKACLKFQRVQDFEN